VKSPNFKTPWPTKNSIKDAVEVVAVIFSPNKKENVEEVDK
jgi:hypothetical protein